DGQRPPVRRERHRLDRRALERERHLGELKRRLLFLALQAPQADLIPTRVKRDREQIGGTGDRYRLRNAIYPPQRLVDPFCLAVPGENLGLAWLTANPPTPRDDQALAVWHERDTKIGALAQLVGERHLFRRVDVPQADVLCRRRQQLAVRRERQPVDASPV